MTAFQFMQTAFFALVGISCLAVSVVIVYAVAAGIYNSVKGGRKHGRK